MKALTKGDILCVQRSGALHVVSEVNDERVALRPPLVMKGMRIAARPKIADMMSRGELYRREVDFS